MATPAEEFVAFFAEGWRRPKPDGFIEHFAPRMAPDVRLVQPLATDAHGRDGFERLFRGAFSLLADYEIAVEDWAAREERTIYLWLRHSATIGGRRQSWRGVDRITLSEAGLIEERIAYFDPLELVPALLRSPRLWPRLVGVTRSGRR